jgi:hypothetical protein
MWGVDLRRVHVTRLDGGAGRIEGDVVHHEGFAVEGDVRILRGLRVLPPERCVIEAGSRASNEAALVAFESMLHQEIASPAELMSRFEEMQHWPFVRHLHVMVRIADPRASSVGESRGNHLFWAHGIPAPECQFEIPDASGEIVGITDWAWPKLGQLGEFDGEIKYGRLVKAGQQPGDVVFAEKQREELLCRLTGMGMVRLVWSDYDRPRLTAERVKRGLNRAG